MPTTTFETSTTQHASQSKYVHDWIFVVQLIDGRVVIGSADNAAKRISRLNSGLVREVPEEHQVYRVLGIKEQTPERNLITTTKYFIEQLGQDKVVNI